MTSIHHIDEYFTDLHTTTKLHMTTESMDAIKLAHCLFTFINNYLETKNLLYYVKLMIF